MEAKKIATREAYGLALKEFGAKYDFYVMDCDLSKSTKTDIFKAEFKERFINCGIAEASMISTAAGLASCNNTVFASSFAMFAAGRAFEQVRNSVAYPKLNVKNLRIARWDYSWEDGATHQCLEDLALMRSLPNMIVINPSDATSTRAAVLSAIEHNGPFYIRTGRLAVDVLYDQDDLKFEIGKGIVLKEGTDASIIATGLMVHEALKACEILKSQGINVRVVDMHTIKPIDKELIVDCAKNTGFIVTCEEHNIYGGLFSAVSEVVTSECPCVVKPIGIHDQFGKSGKPDELMKEYHITKDDIVKIVKESLKK